MTGVIMTPAVLHRFLQPLSNRVMLMLGRAILRAINDTGATQLAQLSLLAEEERSSVEIWHDYGYTSNPPAGLEAAVLFPAGKRNHGIVVAIGDRKFRLRNLQAGEVALYTDEGDSLVFKRGRMIEITTTTLVVKASSKCVFETPLVEVTGNLAVAGTGNGLTCVITGTLTASVDLIGGGKSMIGHKHGGVQAGASQTGVPV